MGRWILYNFALKLGSIIIAALLWFHVVTERWVVETLTAPIRFQNLPEELVVINDIETEIRFQVRTKVKQSILLSYFGRPFMKIDLSTVSLGTNTVDLRDDFIVLPSWRPLEIVGIVGPKKIEIDTDSRTERIIPVRPILSGTPLEGNYVSDFSVNPDTILLIGGNTQIRKIKEVYTDTVDIAGMYKDYSVETQLVMPEPGFSSPVGMVTVQVNFERFASRTFQGITIALTGNEHLYVFPESLEVTVMGPQELLDGIGPDDIGAFVDAKAPGVNIAPFFNLPKGIAFKACNPPRVEVRERKESTE